MQINIPKLEQEQIARMAVAAGYSDVESYVTEHVMALAYAQPNELSPLTKEQLESSLQICDQSIAEFEEGKSLTPEQARQKTLDHLMPRPEKLPKKSVTYKNDHGVPAQS